MFYEVYNDSLVLTLSAHSYPSRALTHMAAKSMIANINQNGLETEFTEFQPTSSQLHYQNPNMYRNILKVIAEIEISKLKKEIENCICFSVQQGGSLDKRQRDNKYMTIRYNDKDDVCDIKTRFIGVNTSDFVELKVYWMLSRVDYTI